MCFFSICLRKNDTKWKQLFKKISMIPYFVKSSLVKKQTIFSKIMSERTIFLWNIEWKIIFCKIIVTNSDNDSDKPTSGATNSAVPTIACTLDKRKLYKIKFFCQFVIHKIQNYSCFLPFLLFEAASLFQSQWSWQSVHLFQSGQCFLAANDYPVKFRISKYISSW